MFHRNYFMKTHLVLLSAVILLATSCSTTMYVSNTVNAPLLKEKQEIKVNADANNLQFAAALTDHFAIMANGFYKSYKGDNNYLHRGGLGELGLGYFKTFSNDNFVFEAYGGAGMGNVRKTQNFNDSLGNAYTGRFDANAGRFFVQPGVGYVNKFFDLALTQRVSFVKYNHFSSSNYPDAELKKDYLYNNEITKNTYIFAEPAVTVRGGYKFIKLQFQYGLTVNVGGQNIRHADNFSSIGLVIDIAKWYDN